MEWRKNGGAPEELPFSDRDPAGELWTNLLSNREGREACGWAEAPPEPVAGEDYDPATHTARWDRASGAYVIEARPPAPPPPPPPEPVPVALTKLQFVGLAQAAGGMTDAMLVTAKKAEAFEAFWLKFDMALDVRRADPLTEASLGALEAAGYLPNGAAAVLAAWPTA